MKVCRFARRCIRFIPPLVVGALISGGAWCAATLELLRLPADATTSSARAVSADGSVVVGDFNAVGPPFYHRAMRWAPTGNTDLGGPTRSATGVSADGSVVVGTTEQPIAYIAAAYRWTAAGGIVPLGFLNGGTTSYANAVSGDGAVVVGRAADGAMSGALRAFRWTAGGGMTSLGTLPGGSWSEALAANGDGTLIVGRSTIGAAETEHAFAWAPATGMSDLGTLPGIPSSVATGVSVHSDVIVGSALLHDGRGYPSSAVPGARAFRWTAASGLTSLGTLNGGLSSYALGVSGDGRVVVGYATDGAAGNQQRGFRWTETGGMQSVEYWLAQNGATLPSGTTTATASAASSDGSVVVGTTSANEAYVARVAPGFGPGLITLNDFGRSVTAVAALVSSRVSAAQGMLHGAHGHPMSGLLPRGGSSLWAAGDAGVEQHAARDGRFGIAEIGIAHAYTERTQASLAAGATLTVDSTPFEGRTRQSSDYVLAEGSVAPLSSNDVWVTGTLLYDAADGTARRGYLNAGRADSSSGDVRTATYGAALRLDLRDLFRSGATAFTPYAKLTWLKSRRNAYAETGGAFPARFDAQVARALEGRLGIDAVHTAGGGIRIVGGLAAATTLSQNTSDLDGSLIGLFAFSLPAQQPHRSWLHAMAGIEARAGSGIASAYLNATTDGPAPSYWVAASYRIRF